MAVPPHGLPRIQPRDPARGRHGADVCRARRRSRLGEAARGCRRQRQRCGCVGRQRHGARRALRITRELVEFLLEKGADPNAAAAGFTALHEAIMRRDEKMVSALCSPTAPIQTRRFGRGRRPAARRRTSISRPHWSARRRSGWPPASPTGRHAPAGEARRRSAVRAPCRLLSDGPGLSVQPDRGDDGADGGDGDGRRRRVGSAGPRRARGADARSRQAGGGAWCRCQCRRTPMAARRSTRRRRSSTNRSREVLVGKGAKPGIKKKPGTTPTP